MKKLTILISLIVILASCKKDEENKTTPTTTIVELVGVWNLIEVLADPGDGSGTFTEVESSKIITFHQDGTLTSNGSLCDMSIEANNPTSGTFLANDSTFRSNDCFDPEYDYSFEQDTSILIINYPCFEPCRAKFEKQ